MPVASHGLPCTQPPSCVCALVRALLRIAPCWFTSNWPYVLRDTPPALGVWMLTTGTPLAAFSTVGCWPRGAPGSATICACARLPTSPNASRIEKHSGRTVASTPPARGASLVPACLPSLATFSATAINRPRVLLNTIR